MPHHSKQRQPSVLDGGVYHPPDPQRTNTSSSQPHSDSFPLPSDRQRMGIQPPTTGPQSRSMHWPTTTTTTTGATGGGEVPPNLYHRVPESPDTQKLVRKHPVHVVHNNNATGETATTTTTGPPSVVASVLLLAAAAQQKADEQQQQQEQSEAAAAAAGDDTGSSVYSHQQSYNNNNRESYLRSPAPSPASPPPPGQATTVASTVVVAAMEGSRPLKKRKMDAERTQTSSTSSSSASPCNVSPMSLYSKSGVSTAETSACDTETVCTTASGSSSYEETNNKNEDPAETGNDEPQHQQEQHQQQQDGDALQPTRPHHHRGPPQQRQSFPAALHWLLTESTSPALEHAAAVRTVLHWLPHGQAWKIIRWDAFRRQILPRFFPEFRLADGTVSVDAFLSEVTAWGFEEIRDGPDVGAFAHTVRMVGTLVASSSLNPTFCITVLSSAAVPSRPSTTVPRNDVLSHRQTKSVLSRNKVDSSRTIVGVYRR